MRVLVTGGNGFLGTHVCRALLRRGDEVVSLDNFCTSDRSKVAGLQVQKGFTFIEADVTSAPEIDGHLDGVIHLACPASPDEYIRLSLETLAIGSHGSELVLALAERNDCRVVLASTSEVYGDPLVHPQSESYWGNVNPIGPRSVYDESKRFAEAMFAARRRVRGTDTAIVRIFNTYGPGLRPNDGRVVSNFVAQALAGTSLTVYGDGSQTRSFCYVSDLVDGLLRMLDSTHPGPINLGKPNETTVLDLATMIIEMTQSPSDIVHEPKPIDDPSVRKPDIRLAEKILHWAPSVSLSNGLSETIAWQRSIALANSSSNTERKVSS
jgi:dTDP-glucose 4,6-dehydratase